MQYRGDISMTLSKSQEAVSPQEGHPKHFLALEGSSKLLLIGFVVRQGPSGWPHLNLQSSWCLDCRCALPCPGRSSRNLKEKKNLSSISFIQLFTQKSVFSCRVWHHFRLQHFETESIHSFLGANTCILCVCGGEGHTCHGASQRTLAGVWAFLSPSDMLGHNQAL